MDKVPKKILVVDDDMDQRDIYEQLFKQSGFEVSIADNGLQAYDMALANPPDLVFTGVIMPKLDGFQLIEQLRKNAMTSRAPVIMFSHLGREEDKMKAMVYENVAFMIKGFDSPKTILEKVKDMIHDADKK